MIRSGYDSEWIRFGVDMIRSGYDSEWIRSWMERKRQRDGKDEDGEGKEIPPVD